MNQKIYLIRHGQTEWTISGQHTGITDIPLTAKGALEAECVGKRLQKQLFDKVLVSPLQRAKKTCEIAGFMDRAIIEPSLRECNYGEYEGKRSKDIHEIRPNWNIFLHGAPGGESIRDIENRAAYICRILQETQGDVAIFSHGHFLRALAAYFIHLSIAAGRHLLLSPAALCILSYERTIPVISLWNDTSHLS